jgi:hypothetical protein
MTNPGGVDDMDVRRSPEMALVLRALPQFDDLLQQRTVIEPEMGPFEAMSLLADWVVARVGSPTQDVLQALDAVEELAGHSELQLAHELVVEFIEATRNVVDVQALMGR